MSDGLITKAKGYGIADTSKYTEFTVKEYELKPAQDKDVTIKITCCGVCSSDVHTITGIFWDMNTHNYRC